MGVERVRYTVCIGGKIKKIWVSQLKELIEAFFKVATDSAFDNAWSNRLQGQGGRFERDCAGTVLEIYGNMHYEDSAIEALAEFLVDRKIECNIAMDTSGSKDVVDENELEVFRKDRGYIFKTMDRSGMWALPHSVIASRLYNYAVSPEVRLRALEAEVPKPVAELTPIEFV